MVSFVHDLMKCIASWKTEQNYRTLNTISKTTLSAYRTVSHEEYGKLLTPFAYFHVKKEIDKAEEAEVLILENNIDRILSAKKSLQKQILFPPHEEYFSTSKIYRSLRE